MYCNELDSTHLCMLVSLFFLSILQTMPSAKLFVPLQSIKVTQVIYKSLYSITEGESVLQTCVLWFTF